MIQFFLKGGPIMWPILALSVITLAVIFERILFLVEITRNRKRKWVTQFLELVGQERYEEALAIAGKSKDYVLKVLEEGLKHREGSLEDALLEAASSQLERFNKGLVVLDTAVTLGPLLGLLGTVTGMMHAFSIVGSGEIAGKQAAITGGVAESLIAVSFGLAVAIVAIIPLNFFNARMERARRRIEEASTRLVLLLKKEKENHELPSRTVMGNASLIEGNSKGTSSSPVLP
ncbi:MotA/TolQ/ExbB proton channel family protein [Candidatus Methylacidiphilum infernorum]|uniref:MotA/TolQ/ExbB proton channel family protein n=1 Tax=Candidatus Methylacidiphilum infernorum TaxID=511746 RepID=A0ABX7PYF1_9BACT|nr:MotA/TolQ/ExbB proton channel family protein [Candidatus Methylacidiphilum infernorum]QSR87676.1 MotA/TolQ/ExbB proton channel family protein [Candidatus Methylacidiphilum infernorum]